jgi:cyclophilin family peptidyl-prolyl cis-trans isomerase
MKHVILSLSLLLATVLDARAADPPEAGQAAPSPSAAAAHNSRVRVITSAGSFIIELNAERAPLSVANFLKYVDEGHYPGTIFHRVIPSFVIQGGGYDAKYALKPAARKVVNEAGNGLSNQRGSVGMARASDPHGADSQFYVNLGDNAALDPNSNRWGYAVFGQVVEGMEVVDQIGNVATGARGPFKEDAPLKPVTIEKIERLSPP